MDIFQYMLLISLLAIGFSCTESACYEQYQTVDNPWDKNKEYFFVVDIEDPAVSYNVSVSIRNNNLYPYQNLWLFYTTTQPGGLVLRDTIECMLADDYGKWLGSGISIYHLNIPLQTRYTFPQKGQYTFAIRQGMRDEKLKGIEQIGVRIEKNPL